MKKKIIPLILCIAFSTQTVFASILGDLLDSTSMQIAPDTQYYKTTFMSDQQGVGKQTEYYAEYTPNPDVLPIVVTGESIWGKRTILQAIDYMKDNHMQPMLGINASFFSLTTGIPMGHVITNGEITSKDNTTLPAIGFRKDGTAFIADLGIYTTATFGEYTIEIPHINKFCQETTQVLNLYTESFGTNTQAQCDTINIILTDIDNKLVIGETVNATVEDIIYESGAIEIPAGKMILTLNVNGNPWAKQPLETLKVGDTVCIENKATVSPELWEDVYNAIGSEGKRLVSNGAIQPDLEAGAAPRTAVGITQSGSVIFYVLDGRQQGHSYGAKQATIAQRMLELGCVDAINLDGGGSTSIAGVYPGSSVASVFNSPSEGSLRQVTNFIFLQNMQEPTGVLDKLYIYPQKQYILTGGSVQVETKAMDAAFYAVEVPADLSYAIEGGNAEIDQKGMVTTHSAGDFTIHATGGGIRESVVYTAIDSPDSIAVYNRDNNKALESITANGGAVVNLYARAVHKGEIIPSPEDSFTWRIASGDIGEITSDGRLILSENRGATGTISVTAGKTTRNIPVTIAGGAEPQDLYPYSEISVTDNALYVDVYSNQAAIQSKKVVIQLDKKDITDKMELTEVDDRHVRYSYLIGDTFFDALHKVTVLSEVDTGHRAFDTWNYTPDQSPDNPFSDMESHWARNIVSYMNKVGIINGIRENNTLYFAPDTPITRAAFAVMMANYLDVDTGEYENVDLRVFADSAQIPQWAKPAVQAMYQLGVINGSLNNGALYFNPNQSITRSEIMTIISRTLPNGLRVAKPEYTDAADVPTWASGAVGVLANAGLVSGYGDKTIRPKNPVTRAEAAVMLFNVY